MQIYTLKPNPNHLKPIKNKLKYFSHSIIFERYVYDMLHSNLLWVTFAEGTACIMRRIKKELELTKSPKSNKQFIEYHSTLISVKLALHVRLVDPKPIPIFCDDFLILEISSFAHLV